MSRSRSLYCHSDTGPTGSTALILREKISVLLPPPKRQPLTLSSQRHFGGNCDSRQSLALVPKYISWLDQSPLCMFHCSLKL
jgi:hypothetical protein